MSHYEHLYINKETLDSSSQEGILKVIFKVATYSSFLRLIHETLIKDFNENCHVTLNEFDPGEVRIHTHWIQRYRCTIEELIQLKEEYVKI